MPTLDYDGTRCEPYDVLLRTDQGEMRAWRDAAIVLACTTGGLLLVLSALGFGVALNLRRGWFGRRAAE